MGRAFQCGMPLGAVSREGVVWESGGSRGVGVGGVSSTRLSLAVRSTPSVLGDGGVSGEAVPGGRIAAILVRAVSIASSLAA